MIKNARQTIWTIIAWSAFVLAISFMAEPAHSARPGSSSSTVTVNNYDTTTTENIDDKKVLQGTAASLASSALKYRFKKSLQLGAGYGYANGIHGFAFGATGVAAGNMVSGSFVIEPDFINDQEQFVGGNIGVTW